MAKESYFAKLLETILNFNPDVWFLIKLAILAGLFLYFGFAIMVVRQVDLMSRALNGAFDIPLKLISRLYLVATIAIFLLALVFL